jgi:hypothetical protein
MRRVTAQLSIVPRYAHLANLTARYLMFKANLVNTIPSVPKVGSTPIFTLGISRPTNSTLICKYFPLLLNAIARNSMINILR